MNSKLSRRVVAQTIAVKLLAEPTRRRHWLKVLAAYLIEQQAIEDVDLMVNDLARELFVQSGHLLSEVTTARPLSESLKREVTRMLKKATGASHIELRETIDRNLIGGFTASTPDAQIDLSIRTKLTRLGAIS